MENGINVFTAACLVLGGIMVLAGVVNTLGSAAEKIVKIFKAAKAPNEEQNGRLDKIEARLDAVDRKLATDKTHLENLDEGNRATQRALLALLDHGIDGNNIKQMQDAKADLTKYLINR